MKRLVYLALLIIPSVALAADPRLSPDQRYKPEVGDLCIVGGVDPVTEESKDSVAAKSEAIYSSLWKEFDSARPLLIARGDATVIKLGTRAEVLILKPYPPNDPRPDAACVRIDEGPSKNRKLWIPKTNLLRQIEGAQRSRAGSDPQAVSLFKAGRNLEKLGKKAGAVEFYSRVVNEFPDTPEAKTALERIAALGAKVRPKVKAKPGIETASVPAKGSGNFPRPKKRRYAPQPRGGSYFLPFVGGGGGSASMCGAPTLTGAPCRRLVAGGGYCYQHR